MAAMAMTYYPDDHENCEAPWECMGCGLSVCPRCDPSPAEPCFCVECDWFRGSAA